MDSFIKQKLRHYAGHVYENALALVIASFIINSVLGVCLLSIELNNDVNKLYYSTETDIHTLQKELLGRYPDLSFQHFQLHSTLNSPVSAEVLLKSLNKTLEADDENVKQELTRIARYVYSIKINTNYGPLTLKTLCAKFNDSCVEELHWTNENERFTASHGVNIQEGHLPTQLRHFSDVKMTFYLRQETSGSYKDSLAWIDAFTGELSALQSNLFTIYYSTSSSFLDTLNSDTYIDIRYFGLVFTIFITYCGFLLSGGNCLTKQVNIGRMGIVVTPLSVLGAWGLLTANRVQFTNMTGVIPLVLLILQVNNVQLMLRRLAETAGIPEGKVRIQMAVEKSAGPILIFSLATSLPFLAGFWSTFKAIRLVSAYTVLTMVFSFINHWTMFLGCLASNEKRIDNRKHWCACTTVDQPDAVDSSKGACYRCCCTGQPQTFASETESSLQRLTKCLLSRVVLTIPAKFISLLLCVTLLGTAVWFCKDVKPVTYTENDIAVGSPFYDFFQSNKNIFPREPYIMYAFEKGAVIDNFTCGNVLLALDDYKLRTHEFLTNKSIFWYEHYLKSNFSVAKSDFVNSVLSFVQHFPEYSEDIEFDVNNSNILSYRFYIKAHPDGWDQNIQVLLNLIGDTITLGEYHFDIYSHRFLLFYGYARSLWEPLVFIGIESFVMFVVISIYSRQPCIALFSVMWYTYCNACIIGISVALGVHVTSVCALVLMCTATITCNAVIYSHIEYLGSEGTHSSARSYTMVSTATTAVFNTLFGTLLGLMVMFVNESLVFVTIFKCFVTCVVVNLLTICLFIPNFLSLVGGTKGENNVQMEIKLTVKDTSPCDDGYKGEDNFGFAITNKNENERL